MARRRSGGRGQPRYEPLDAVVSDYAYGLPAAAASIALARDASLAVPSDDGDGVLIMRRIRL